MKPKACNYCGEVLGIQRWVLHTETCAVKTKKCDTCQRYIKNKDLTNHIFGECQKFTAENEA